MYSQVNLFRNWVCFQSFHSLRANGTNTMVACAYSKYSLGREVTRWTQGLDLAIRKSLFASFLRTVFLLIRLFYHWTWGKDNLSYFIPGCEHLQMGLHEAKLNYRSQVEGTSRTIWSHLSWHKPGLDKLGHHPVQLNLKSIWCWVIHHFPGEIIPVADCSHPWIKTLECWVCKCAQGLSATPRYFECSHAETQRSDPALPRLQSQLIVRFPGSTPREGACCILICIVWI